MRRGPLETEISGRKTRTSHAQVVDELGREIISGHYSVGTTLPGDQDLAQRFKVSRTVLREAMEGALKLKEISYIHAEGYEIGRAHV